MKWLLIAMLLVVACEEYHSPLMEEMVEEYGQCGKLCPDRECQDFFEELPCLDQGYYGECYEGECWINWDATCETGEPIPWQ